MYPQIPKGKSLRNFFLTYFLSVLRGRRMTEASLVFMRVSFSSFHCIQILAQLAEWQRLLYTFNFVDKIA